MPLQRVDIEPGSNRRTRWEKPRQPKKSTTVPEEGPVEQHTLQDVLNLLKSRGPTTSPVANRAIRILNQKEEDKKKNKKKRDTGLHPVGSSSKSPTGETRVRGKIITPKP